MRALGAALVPRGARRFFLAHAQSSIGSGIALVGLPLLAYERFHTPWALTVVLLCELFPAVALGPVLGALADRLPRRTCLVAADVLRLGAFAALAFVPSLGLMIVCALIAGIGTALFNPSALASLSQVSSPRVPAGRDEPLLGARRRRPHARPRDRGRPAARLRPADADGGQRLSRSRSPRPARDAPAGRADRPPSMSLLASLRSGTREIAAQPGVRLLLGSSTVAVIAVGMVNVGEVMLARELLGVGGSGLAALMTASGVGTFLGSSFGARTGTTWQWRKAYMLGLVCMAVDLILCAVAPFFWLVLVTFALGGFGNGLALVHDRLLLAHSVPEALHGRLFALHKTCTSGAFVIAFLAAGVLISTLGVQAMFLFAGLLLVVIILVVRPHLRALWPEPVAGEPAAPRCRCRRPAPHERHPWDDPELYELENADDPHFDLAFWRGLIERRAPRRMLELGSGTGRLTFPLAAAGLAADPEFAIVGLDCSEPLLAHARARRSRRSPHRCARRCGSRRATCARSRWRTASTSSIVPFNSLAYLHTRADQLACLRAARAHLAPGGAFAFDVLAPRFDFLAEALHPFPPMRVDADIADPAPGVERFVRSCVDRYDPSTQTLSSTLFYDVHRNGGASERQVRDLDWHMYFPAELEGLLDAAGLAPLERRGGWNGEPLDAGARRYVFVCGEV